MSQDRAVWEDRATSVLLDLILQQKELCHWTSAHGPTSLAWTKITHDFNQITDLGYSKKTCQNKFNELKRCYFNWRDGQTHTGLGRDPLTGEVTADPELYGASPGVLTTRIFFEYFVAIRFVLTQY